MNKDLTNEQKIIIGKAYKYLKDIHVLNFVFSPCFITEEGKSVFVLEIMHDEPIEGKSEINSVVYNAHIADNAMTDAMTFQCFVYDVCRYIVLDALAHQFKINGDNVFHGGRRETLLTAR